ncbi:hypothetical protein SprV_0200687000 [Sparganum proliferum]
MVMSPPVLADQEDQNNATTRTLKNFLKRLHINPETWEDLVWNRLAWRREVKTGTDIYEANRIAAAKDKREVCKSQVPRLLSVSHLPLPTCPRCKRAFRARLDLNGHLRTKCTVNLTASTTLAPAANLAPTAISVTVEHTVAATLPPSTNVIRPAPTSTLTAAARITTTIHQHHHHR